MMITDMSASAARRATSTSTRSRRCRSRPAAPTSRRDSRRAAEHGDQARHQRMRGSARFLLTDEAWQWDLDFAAGARPGRHQRQPHQQDPGLRLRVGGPIVKDRLWLWGAYGRNQVNLFNVNGNPDNAALEEDVNGKMNIQLFDSTALAGTFTDGNKIKAGRGATHRRRRPPGTRTARLASGRGSSPRSSPPTCSSPRRIPHVDNEFSLLHRAARTTTRSSSIRITSFQGSYFASRRSGPGAGRRKRFGLLLDRPHGPRAEVPVHYRSTGVDSDLGLAGRRQLRRPGGLQRAGRGY